MRNFEEDNYIQVNLEDIKQELLEYEREILEKNFQKEIEEEKNLVKRLISQNDSISKAEKYMLENSLLDLLLIMKGINKKWN